MNIGAVMGLVAALALVGVVGTINAEDSTAGSEEAQKMQDVHRELSVAYFNQCWTFIDKAERTPEDVDNMILLAHSSLWHWKQRSDVKPVNLSVGYWQASRVHALAGQHQMAKYFGDKCLNVGIENSLPPFYVGYAYEALARAEAARGAFADARSLLANARSQLESVTDKEERDLLEADLLQIEKMLPKEKQSK